MRSVYIRAGDGRAPDGHGHLGAPMAGRDATGPSLPGLLSCARSAGSGTEDGKADRARLTGEPAAPTGAQLGEEHEENGCGRFALYRLSATRQDLRAPGDCVHAAPGRMGVPRLQQEAGEQRLGRGTVGDLSVGLPEGLRGHRSSGTGGLPPNNPQPPRGGRSSPSPRLAGPVSPTRDAARVDRCGSRGMTKPVPTGGPSSGPAGTADDSGASMRPTPRRRPYAQNP
jgi:hypothetical protein